MNIVIQFAWELDIDYETFSIWTNMEYISNDRAQIK